MDVRGTNYIFYDWYSYLMSGSLERTLGLSAIGSRRSSHFLSDFAGVSVLIAIAVTALATNQFSATINLARPSLPIHLFDPSMSDSQVRCVQSAISLAARSFCVAIRMGFFIHRLDMSVGFRRLWTLECF